MFIFENRLLKLKHDVLTSVAVLAREKKMNRIELENISFAMIQGESPTYRDTVDRERKIIVERAKLAAGFKLNGTYGEDLINIDQESQILYVIKEACDRCSTKKFKVTNACRNCVAQKCQSACNFGAISYVNGMAVIDLDKCRECGMCKNACPYDAITENKRPCMSACPTGALSYNLEDLSAEIIEEKCVNCGACMAACPFGAIEDRSLLGKVVNDLVENETIYAMVAPAITGQFGSKTTFGQVKNAIRVLGFKDMVEVACGADAVTVHETNEFIGRMEKGDEYMTTSCCPGFVSYIEKMFPDQQERISDTVSPMIATGRYIKNKEPNAKVVFIGPCTAKKAEALRESVKDGVDYVLTFEELFALFAAFEINPSTCEETTVEDASVLGREFARGGGVTAAIESYLEEKGIKAEFLPVRVSGGAEVRKTMMMAKKGDLQGNFIEGMMCAGGCINGSAKSTSVTKAKARFTRINQQTSIKSVLANLKSAEYLELNLER